MKNLKKIFAKVVLIIGKFILADSESVLTKINATKLTFVPWEFKKFF